MLPPGTTGIVTVTGTVAASASGTMSNTATVVATNGTDPVSSNNSATDTDDVWLGASMSVTNTDGSETASIGQTVTYTIVVANAGPNDVPGAVVEDDVPAGLQGATWTCAPSLGASCTAAGTGNISDTVNIPGGAMVTYTLTATWRRRLTESRTRRRYPCRRATETLIPATTAPRTPIS